MCNNTRYQKSSLEAYNNTTQALATNSPITFANTSVHTGCSIKFNPSSTTISLKSPGLYLIAFDEVASNSTTASGVVSTQLFKNGVAAPDAFSSSTSASSTDFVSLAFTKLIRVDPSCCAVDNTTNITFVNTGVDANVAHVNVTVIKLA